ncbi:MAG: flippase-like domain-containing protein [Clostridia bacterium]|nr:flippase-like domain-containing protein [Clostridia bacterium]
MEIDEETQELKLVVVDEDPPEEADSERFSEEENELPKVVIDNPKQLNMTKMLGFETDKSIDKRRRFLKNVVTAIFVAFVIGVLFYTAVADFTSENLASFDDVSKTILHNWYYIIYAVLSLLIFFVAKGLLRAFLCRSVTGKFRFHSSFNAGVVCQFYNFVTPLAMGGQPFEISYLAKKKFEGGHASSISLSSYLINMFTYAILYLFAILAYKNNWLNYVPNAAGNSVLDYFPHTILVAAIVGTSISLFMPALILIFSIFPRLGYFIVNFIIWIIGKLRLTKDPKLLKIKLLRTLIINSRSMKRLFRKPLTLLLSSLFGFAEALAYATIAYFVLKFFGFDWEAPHILEWLQVVTIITLINAASSFIPTPGSSGAADISFYALFSIELLGGFGFTAMLIWRMLSFYLIIILGFVFVKTVIKRDIERTKYYS